MSSSTLTAAELAVGLVCLVAGIVTIRARTTVMLAVGIALVLSGAVAVAHATVR